MGQSCEPICDWPTILLRLYLAPRDAASECAPCRLAGQIKAGQVGEDLAGVGLSQFVDNVDKPYLLYNSL